MEVMASESYAGQWIVVGTPLDGFSIQPTELFLGGPWENQSITIQCYTSAVPGTGRGDTVMITASITLERFLSGLPYGQAIPTFAFSLGGSISNPETGELTSSWSKSPPTNPTLPSIGKILEPETTTAYYPYDGDIIVIEPQYDRRVRKSVIFLADFQYSASSYAAALTGTISIMQKTVEEFCSPYADWIPQALSGDEDAPHTFFSGYVSYELTLEVHSEYASP